MASNVVKRATKLETNKKYSHIAHEIRRGLANLREEDDCTDFEVVVQEKSFRCHKAVLASVSEYFRGMLASGMKESIKNQTTIDNISSEAFKVILDLLYLKDSDEDPIADRPDDEIAELLRVADMFRMSFLNKICLDYFRESMNAENCVERWKIGRTSRSDELRDMSWQHILQNFENVQKASVLSSLEYEEFLSIVQDENLVVANEVIVWQAISDWIGFDRPNRGEKIAELLNQCCLAEMDYMYLVEELSFEESIRADKASVKLVQNAIKARNHPGSSCNTGLKFRTCHGKEEVSVAIGIADGKNKATMMFYSSRNQRFNTRDVPDKLAECDQFACCFHDRNIYICGGTGQHSNLMHKFSCVTGRWTEYGGKMPEALKRHAMIATDDCLYTVGGRLWREINASVLQFCLRSGSWDIHGELIAPVEQPSAVCLNNRIYIIGGNLGGQKEGTPADGVQVYDIKTANCTIVCNLPNPCIFSCAMIRKEEIFVATSNGEIIRLAGKNTEPVLVTTIPEFAGKKWFALATKGDTLKISGGVVDREGAEERSKDVVYVNLKSAKFYNGKPLPKGYVFYGSLSAVVENDLMDSTERSPPVVEVSKRDTFNM